MLIVIVIHLMFCSNKSVNGKSEYNNSDELKNNENKQPNNSKKGDENNYGSLI